MFEPKILDRYQITGRGPGIVIESVPEGITDLYDLKGMHILVDGEVHEITAVEMFAVVDGNLRVEGPQGVLIKRVEQ